jgi:hypothetical protein
LERSGGPISNGIASIEKQLIRLTKTISISNNQINEFIIVYIRSGSSM